MGIFDKLTILEKRLEALKQLQDSDVDYLKEQIDKIAFEELPHLEDETNNYQISIYNGQELDEKEENTLNQLYDALAQVDATIHLVREQFGLSNSTENYEQSYEYSDDDFHKESESNEFLIVLNEIAKSALRTLDIDNTDSHVVSLMETILLGISIGEKDFIVIGRAFTELVLSGSFLERDKIKDIYKKTHEKCQFQILGLRLAIDNIRNYNCSAEETLAQIAIFL